VTLGPPAATPQTAAEHAVHAALRCAAVEASRAWPRSELAAGLAGSGTLAGSEGALCRRRSMIAVGPRLAALVAVLF
jgi:hypothetical protein